MHHATLKKNSIAILGIMKMEDIRPKKQPKYIWIGENWNEIEKSMISRAKLIRCKNIKAHLSL